MVGHRPFLRPQSVAPMLPRTSGCPLIENGSASPSGLWSGHFHAEGKLPQADGGDGARRARRYRSSTSYGFIRNSAHIDRSFTNRLPFVRRKTICPARRQSIRVSSDGSLDGPRYVRGQVRPHEEFGPGRAAVPPMLPCLSNRHNLRSNPRDYYLTRPTRRLSGGL